MNKNLMFKKNGCGLVCKLPFFALFFSLSFMVSLDAQQLKRTFEREIEVTRGITIKTQGPQSVRISGQGQLNSRHVGGQYVVSGKKATPYIYVIDKKLDIHTWDKNSIKQVVEVTVSCASSDAASDLLAGLDIELRQNAAGQVQIDCEMNIDKFQIDNSWFRADRNSIVLDDGEEFFLEQLSLRNTLFVPQNCHLIIEGERLDLSVGNHRGKLDLNLIKGSIRAKQLGVIKGELNSLNATMDQAETVDLKVKNVHLEMDKVDQLLLQSAISHFEITNARKVVVNNSLNDHYKLEKVDLLYVEQSLFSDFNVSIANDKVEMNLKNSDVFIDRLQPECSFLSISNQQAKVQVGIQALAAAEIICRTSQQTTFNLSDSIEIIKSLENETIYGYGDPPFKTKIEIDCNLCDVSLK